MGFDQVAHVMMRLKRSSKAFVGNPNTSSTPTSPNASNGLITKHCSLNWQPFQHSAASFVNGSGQGCWMGKTCSQPTLAFHKVGSSLPYSPTSHSKVSKRQSRRLFHYNDAMEKPVTRPTSCATPMILSLCTPI